ncbi:venom allergen 5-like [Tropilaelaps mercedesae]|uniref:Venom allergen 5-like n=1 Tax=Tropilaelaps mercedesae TaxID=418985 RepID=A0A1V9X2L1_9ACAR|nr:venom allergen 5-like [Tropilaelaps mercedesae]
MFLMDGVRTCLKAMLVCVILGVPVAVSACDYAKFTREHTMCLRSSCRTGRSGVSTSEQKTIVKLHNRWRSQVANGSLPRLPPASNMRYLRWDPELANVAQAHAKQCRFEHDCKSCRQVGRFSTGQNLFTAWAQTDDDPVSDWSSAIDAWFHEYRTMPADVVKSFRFGNDFAHFTQAAWATTRFVGCGYAMFRQNGRYVHLYTCNYGEAGNVWGTPIYKAGKPCSRCPKKTKCFQALCT